MSHEALMHALAASRLFSELDRSLARLLGRIAAAQNSPELLLATMLASQQSAAGHACAVLGEFAGQPVDPTLPNSPAYPDLSVWLEALRASPSVVGQPVSLPASEIGPAAGEKPLMLAGDRIYLARFWHYEAALASWIEARLAQVGTPAWQTHQGLKSRIDRLFPPALEGGTDWQRTAAVNALAGRFSIISGGPGTGKTTTVARLLVLLLEHEPELRIALAAPTGKAAARLKEALKNSASRLEALDDEMRQRLLELPATTLHRLLGARWGSSRFRHDAEHPLAYDLILVDEASMIDLALMVKLLGAIPPQARLILLGDKDQLASVEAGSVLGDLCALAQADGFSPARRALLDRLAPGDYQPHAGLLDDSVVLLKTSWRFDSSGGIGQLARAIQSGEADEALTHLQAGRHKDIRWQPLPAANQREAQLSKAAIAGYLDYLNAVSPGEALKRWERFMVLAALRSGPYGVDSLNRTIETLLRREGLIQAGEDWYHRRPVMITANDEAQRLYNGDIGVVWREGKRARVWFSGADGTLRDLVPARLGRHQTAWAMTIHKSQGSEFDKILLLLPDNDSPLLTRELVYTGLTRAKTQAELWGSEELLHLAITRRIRRASGLAWRLGAQVD